jgi:4-amino-4-deoxychorismate lyase
MESALREGGRDPGLKLIETLGWDGSALIRADAHLARLERSAHALGWSCDPEAAHSALLSGRDAQARLRLTLDRTGRIEVTAGPFLPSPSPWRLALAPARLTSTDPWLGIKTTRRAAYDAARATLPAGIDEVVFLNERGDVCDGSITTVFFDRGDGMRTPPLTAGLLPGVLRGALIGEGRATEEALTGEDLPGVRLWVGNSLRGLIAAVWAG